MKRRRREVKTNAQPVPIGCTQRQRSLIANPVRLQKLQLTWKNGDSSQTFWVASCEVLLESN